MSPGQRQQGGLGSQNVQIGTLVVGPSLEDVRAIAKDVFDANFAALGGGARETAEARVSNFREEFVEELRSLPDEAVASFNQVEKQLALYEAQKGYALSGDEELKEILITAVIEVSKQPERSLKSIVLQESIKVMPTLTPEHLRILGTIFAIRYVHYGVDYFENLLSEWIDCAGTKNSGLKPTAGDFRHLEYVGCGKSSLASISFDHLLQHEYPSFLVRGYSEEEVRNRFAPDEPPAYFFPTHKGSTLYRPASHSVGRLDKQFPQITPRERELIAPMFTERAMAVDELIESVAAAVPDAQSFRQQWTSSGIGSFELTSVGIAVGHTVLGAKGRTTGDLAIWI